METVVLVLLLLCCDSRKKKLLNNIISVNSLYGKRKTNSVIKIWKHK